MKSFLIIIFILINTSNLFADAKTSLDKTKTIINSQNKILEEEKKIVTEDGKIIKNTNLPLLNIIFEEKKTNSLIYKE